MILYIYIFFSPFYDSAISTRGQPILVTVLYRLLRRRRAIVPAKNPRYHGYVVLGPRR